MKASIRWPSEYEPSRSAVFVSNHIAIEAPPATVWAWLVRAKNWPDWYSNSSEIHLPVASPDLAPGMRFAWRTFGISLESRVREFEPYSRLAWDARSMGVNAYHAWLLEPLDNGRGTRVLTEETQHGWLARLGKLTMPGRMSRFHQIWLEGLKARAEAGTPSGRKPA